ncbi:hypothetical protein HPB50_024534 [Hyalomma asiaticum]|uniref:Uncharacterized protein n=1 Tax=Hyalomma asiaticum TaxID=266040 RepID=A0ACB7SMV1_HYAAI|nr:hypothetical protein HPB50_024534 [Hyalomma asiaticum]
MQSAGVLWRSEPPSKPLARRWRPAAAAQPWINNRSVSGGSIALTPRGEEQSCSPSDRGGKANPSSVTSLVQEVHPCTHTLEAETSSISGRSRSNNGPWNRHATANPTPAS